MRTTAEVTAAKIQRVARRLAEGCEISEAGEGVYMVWAGRAVTSDLVEIVAAEHGRPFACPIPADADPALTAGDLIVKYAADRLPL